MSDDERSDEKMAELHTLTWGAFKETDIGGVVKFESPSSGTSYIAVFRSEAEARAAKDAPAMLDLLRRLESPVETAWGEGEECHKELRELRALLDRHGRG